MFQRFVGVFLDEDMKHLFVLQIFRDWPFHPQESSRTNEKGFQVGCSGS